jgi:NADH-quinone oxidoreductase subunit G
MVDIEGRGLVASCSTPPEAGLKVKTSSQELRELRRISIELLLASHDYSCPTCQKNTNCKLQDLARKLGVTKVRFKNVKKSQPLDDSSPSLVRDPTSAFSAAIAWENVCRSARYRLLLILLIAAQRLCSAGVRERLEFCRMRLCGQCANVCPTGALTPKYQIDEVWKALEIR